MPMTWGELKGQIINLGFDTMEEYSADPSRFIEASNRAVDIITSTVFPIVRRITVTQQELTNLLDYPGHTRVFHGTSDITYISPGGRGFTFESDGTGTAVFSRDGYDTVTVNMVKENGFTVYKGLLPGTGNVTITFSGDYAYNIQNLAVYEILPGPTVNDIPAYSGYQMYDMALITNGDFKNFSEERPIYIGEPGSGREHESVQDFTIEENRFIILPTETSGQYEISYQARPTPITSSTSDSFAIEVEEMALPLVPLLAAHYAWLDDDERKAVMYWNEYDSLKAEIFESRRRSKAAGTAARLINTMGWY